MRCYYEVLGLGHNADAAAIKKAYRVQALQWHPDKNQHRLAEADERFKEISNAYEVLSDEHERAWYDSHREQILNADSHQAGSWGVSRGARPADEEDLFSYFSARCYAGYGDDKRGFYAVYDTLFEKLVQQEVKVAERCGDAEAHEAASSLPRFGQSTATWARVSAFYDHFQSFATLKDFAWSDEHNPAAAPNRKVRRLIEEENSKRRKALRRHYNETVRELATFVRKRDKRVLAHNAEEAAKRTAREAEVKAQRAADKAARAAAAAQYQEADWITASEARGGSSEEESELEDLVHWECVICNKLFRSEKALENHERSKKHLEQLAEVRQMLEEEEAQLGGDSEAAAEPLPSSGSGAAEQQPGGGGAEAEADSGDAVPSARLSIKQRKKKQQKSARRGAAAAGSGSDNEAEDGAPVQRSAASGAAASDASSEASEAAEVDEDEMLAAMMRSAAGRQQQPAAASSEEDPSEDGDSSSGSGSEEAAELDEEVALAAMMASASVRQQQPADAASSSDEADSGSGDAGSGDGGAAAVAAAAGVAAEALSPAPDDDGCGQKGAAEAQAATEPPTNGKPAKGKRRRAKGGKKGAAAAAAAAAAEHEVSTKPLELECAVCCQEFASRTKLFAHIKQSGHARLK